MSLESDDAPRGDDHLRAIAVSRGDRDRALDAMHALEAAVAMAGPGREQDWRRSVLAALEGLTTEIAEQQGTYARRDSLMAQLAQDDPRLRTWVRQLHHRWSSLAATTQDLADDLRATHSTGSRSIDDIREQVRWISAALQHHRAREADLIFAALGLEIGDP
jgi:hypothetical protein